MQRVRNALGDGILVDAGNVTHAAHAVNLMIVGASIALLFNLHLFLNIFYVSIFLSSFDGIVYRCTVTSYDAVITTQHIWKYL